MDGTMIYIVLFVMMRLDGIPMTINYLRRIANQWVKQFDKQPVDIELIVMGFLDYAQSIETQKKKEKLNSKRT
jgi:replication initiation and membrane attachment protein DnaB